MPRILDQLRLKAGNPASRIQFGTAGGGSWEIWDRYLLLDGKRAYHVGNICNTCAFFFERLPRATGRVQTDQCGETLRAGVRTLSDPLVALIGAGLPPDICLT